MESNSHTPSNVNLILPSTLTIGSQNRCFALTICYWDDRLEPLGRDHEEKDRYFVFIDALNRGPAEISRFHEV